MANTTLCHPSQQEGRQIHELSTLPRNRNSRLSGKIGAVLNQYPALWRRYLVAMCSGGQLSNRLICLRRTFMDGALLGRKVILPSTGIDYNYDQLLGGVNLRGAMSASRDLQALVVAPQSVHFPF